MSNTTKKLIIGVRQRVQELHQLVAAARQHSDDPQELRNLEEQLSSALDELSALATQRGGGMPRQSLQEPAERVEPQ